MSTRKLILAALLCGMAILVAFTVQVEDSLVKVLLQQAGAITKSAVTSSKVPPG